MQLFFETRPDLTRLSGKMYWFQTKPTLTAQPVLEGDNEADGLGVSLYGSVMRDGGMYRMWYQAWPRAWAGKDSSCVGYAESNDGITWRKPMLNRVEMGGTKNNNLCNLGVHLPCVFIDPQSPPAKRYRATGCTLKDSQGGHPDATVKGYYTAHSADGLHWTLDSTTPTWPWSDVITSMYHPQRGEAQVALKRMVYGGGFTRRAIWEASGRNGQWSGARCALIPDDFDDVASMARGYRSSDYYGMGMMPAGRSTVGFLWQFRHRYPLRTPGAALFGEVDVSLTYQHAPGEQWIHAPGRSDFISHHDLPWTHGGVYTAANAIDAGDEQRLYFCGVLHSHGWHLDSDWKLIEEYAGKLRAEGFGKIGYASWPKDRLFGYRGDPEGSIGVDLGVLKKPVRFVLNYQALPGGSIRAEVLTRAPSGRVDAPGRKLDESLPLTGDSLGAVVRWREGDVIHPMDNNSVVIVLWSKRASVFAFDVIDA